MCFYPIDSQDELTAPFIALPLHSISMSFELYLAGVSVLLEQIGVMVIFVFEYDSLLIFFDLVEGVKEFVAEFLIGVVSHL